ncbi:unnamed protein product [Cylicostephanus goldi]|uniref:Uncharacterized protein n=1 Tax=Cylicostephanus goldi TaxID=71465 RepID=A0A3P6T0A5_CYLGO|nr:unnamed protein product [Cylicostephanus goldi]
MPYIRLVAFSGEEGQQEEGGAEGSGDHSAEASPAPAPAQEAAAAPEGGTESPKKLARMGNSIVPVIVGIGAALL